MGVHQPFLKAVPATTQVSESTEECYVAEVSLLLPGAQASVSGGVLQQTCFVQVRYCVHDFDFHPRCVRASSVNCINPFMARVGTLVCRDHLARSAAPIQVID